MELAIAKIMENVTKQCDLFQTFITFEARAFTVNIMWTLSLSGWTAHQICPHKGSVITMIALYCFHLRGHTSKPFRATALSHNLTMTQCYTASIFLLIIWILHWHLALVSHFCMLLPIEPPQGMAGCWHRPHCQPPTPKRCASVGIMLPNVTTLY